MSVSGLLRNDRRQELHRKGYLPESGPLMNSTDHNTARLTLPRRRMWTALLTGNGLLVVGVALVCTLLALGGDAARLALRYQRDAVLTNHQWWRLLSGHLVHGDTHHLQVNVIGLVLIATLCRRCYAWREWLVILAIVVLSMDLGFVFLMPELHWYVGLSGALHGVLAAGAWRWWQIEPKPLAALLSVILVGKLALEQWQGPLPLSGDMPVIINAHLYGAVGGVLAAAALHAKRWLVRAEAVT